MDIRRSQIFVAVVMLACPASTFAESCIAPLNLPKPLENYVAKVEKESGRPTCIIRQLHLSLPTGAEWRDDRVYNLIVIEPRFDISDPGNEQGIAHEITHGRLIYGKHYPTYRISDSARPEERRSVNLLLSTIADAVVNKTIQAEGFTPFPAGYLGVVKGEAAAALAGQNVYVSMFPDSSFRSKFIAARYLVAWSFLEYCALSVNEKDGLESFLRASEREYPSEIEIAKQVQVAMEHHDIFRSEGYRQAVTESLRAWKLDQFVQEVK
jgi:hypothetical protein